MEVFKELVENKVADSRGRLNQMIDSTKGEDKEILSEVGFKTAKPLLDKKIYRIAYNHCIIL